MFNKLHIKHKLILLLAALVLFIGHNSFAQDEGENALEVFGQVTSDLGEVKSANIEIKQDDKQWLKVKFNKRSGEFNLTLPVGHTFLFRFTQEGTIAKQISFSTKVPELYSKVEFDPFFFMVHLNDYTGTPELDTLFYTDPVGKIFFAEEFIKFDYDREYNLYVKNKVASVKQEVDLKQQMLAQKQEAKRLDSIAKAQSVVMAEVDQDKQSKSDMDTVLADNTLGVLDTAIQYAVKEALIPEPNSDTIIVEPEPQEEIAMEALQETVVAEPLQIETKAEEPVAENVKEEMPKEESLKKEIEPKEENLAVIKEETLAIETAVVQQTKSKPEPVPVAIGKKNGNEYEFLEYVNSQVTKIYVTRSRKTIIYSMYQYNNGQTRYFKQQPLSNDSLQINRAIFTRAIKQ